MPYNELPFAAESVGNIWFVFDFNSMHFPLKQRYKRQSENRSTSAPCRGDNKKLMTGDRLQLTFVEGESISTLALSVEGKYRLLSCKQQQQQEWTDCFMNPTPWTYSYAVVVVFSWILNNWMRVHECGKGIMQKNYYDVKMLMCSGLFRLHTATC